MRHLGSSNAGVGVRAGGRATWSHPEEAIPGRSLRVCHMTKPKCQRVGQARLHFPEDRIAEFCRRHHIRRLALFGSVLRDDFTAESDVDVLVEFAPGKTPGLAFITMQDGLSEILGQRRVDLHTFSGIERSRNRLLREEILKTAGDSV